MDKFVLIGGMPRSGTNLTRRIVGSHSNIAIPTAEFHFLKGHAQGRTVRQILSNERLQDWGIDYADLYDQSPPQVYVTVLRRYASKKGKEIFGEKSPGNEFYLYLAEHWLKDFELKCIIMMRNPLDVIASYKFIPSARGSNEGDPSLIARTARDWCRSVTLGLARSYAQPRNYLLLRYEDLVSDPLAKAQELCNFIGISFEESRMLSLADFSEHKDNTSFAKQDNLNQTYRVYRPDSRKRFLSADEVSTICNMCGEVAWAVGYNDENLTPSSQYSSRRQASDLELTIRNKIARWSRSLFSQERTRL